MLMYNTSSYYTMDKLVKDTLIDLRLDDLVETHSIQVQDNSTEIIICYKNKGIDNYEYIKLYRRRHH